MVFGCLVNCLQMLDVAKTIPRQSSCLDGRELDESVVNESKLLFSTPNSRVSDLRHRPKRQKMIQTEHLPVVAPCGHVSPRRQMAMFEIRFYQKTRFLR
jgi:hypothetical protein